jgi:hypothetical protein
VAADISLMWLRWARMRLRARLREVGRSGG